jgi:hypothetical protein
MNVTIARQMIAAEILKLRRNRGVMAFALVLSIGVVVLFFGYRAVEHATTPARNGPAGGLDAFAHAVRLIGLYFGTLTAILIGAEAGTADLASGVFRDLVATGRSRVALFFVRAPAAILVTLVFTLSAFVVALAASAIFAGGLAMPSAGVVVQSAGWIVLANSVAAALAVGVGSLTGSRALTLTAVIGFETIVSQLLINVPSLGSARDALPTVALNQLIPVRAPIELPMGSAVAVAVIAAWAVVPAAIGAWRSATQDA